MCIVCSYNNKYASDSRIQTHIAEGILTFVKFNWMDVVVFSFLLFGHGWAINRLLDYTDFTFVFNVLKVAWFGMFQCYRFLVYSCSFIVNGKRFRELNLWMTGCMNGSRWFLTIHRMENKSNFVQNLHNLKWTEHPGAYYKRRLTSVLNSCQSKKHLVSASIFFRSIFRFMIHWC